MTKSKLEKFRLVKLINDSFLLTFMSIFNVGLCLICYIVFKNIWFLNIAGVNASFASFFSIGPIIYQLVKTYKIFKKEVKTTEQ